MFNDRLACVVKWVTGGPLNVHSGVVKWSRGMVHAQNEVVGSFYCPTSNNSCLPVNTTVLLFSKHSVRLAEKGHILKIFRLIPYI